MISKTAQLLVAKGIVLFASVPAQAQDAADPDPAIDFAALAESEVALATLESFNQQAIIGMIGIVVIIVSALIFATLRERRKQDLLARFADQGQQVPRELLPPAPSRHREMRRGVWILSLGMGLGLVLYFATGDWEIAVWCLIPLFLGVASFINATFFYPESRSEP